MIQSYHTVLVAKRRKKTYNVYLELRGSLGSSKREYIGEKNSSLAEGKNICFTVLIFPKVYFWKNGEKKKPL